VRNATVDDAAAVARLLDEFNLEFGDPTPGVPALEKRMRELIVGSDTTVLITGDEPVGLVVLRFRRSIWGDDLECNVAELYVIPSQRGHGIGRALMEEAIDHARRRGADYMDLSTNHDDAAARALYESLGFSNREGGPEGPINYFYGRDL
jgi:ribosomal protein S18 acetylase RimI-like enzyme